MRGRQQVYPTFEPASNRAALRLESRRNMPVFGAQEWAYGCHVHPRAPRWGMSGCAWGGPGGTCPFLAGRSGRMGAMSIRGRLGGACPVEARRGSPHLPWTEGREGQLGEAEKFRYSSICF